MPAAPASAPKSPPPDDRPPTSPPADIGSFLFVFMRNSKEILSGWVPIQLTGPACEERGDDDCAQLAPLWICIEAGGR